MKFCTLPFSDAGSQKPTINRFLQSTSPFLIRFCFLFFGQMFSDHIIKDVEVMCVHMWELGPDVKRCWNPTCSYTSGGRSVSPHFSQDAALSGPAPTWKWHHRSGKSDTSQSPVRHMKAFTLFPHLPAGGSSYSHREKGTDLFRVLWKPNRIINVVCSPSLLGWLNIMEEFQ